jgi:hypothetical protein
MYGQLASFRPIYCNTPPRPQHIAQKLDLWKSFFHWVEVRLGLSRKRSLCTTACPLTPDSPPSIVPLYLERRCGRTLEVRFAVDGRRESQGVYILQQRMEDKLEDEPGNTVVLRHGQPGATLPFSRGLACLMSGSPYKTGDIVILRWHGPSLAAIH